MVGKQKTSSRDSVRIGWEKREGEIFSPKERLQRSLLPFEMSRRKL
jgi:hypothetical protein